MTSDNRRQAVRIPCNLPIRLQGEESDFVGRIVDISRTGLRLCLGGHDLGVHRLASLVQVTRRIQDLLGETFEGELHFEMLGPLVKRQLSPTRIAKRDWERTDVEVGCAFDRPLTNDEAGMLGVPLPPVGSSQTPTELEGAGPRRRSGASRPARPGPRLNRPKLGTYTAYLYPEPGKHSVPLVTYTRSITPAMAVLEVEPGQCWESEAMDVANAILALDEAYGSRVLIRIVDGDTDLWAGPAEIKEVDALHGGAAIKLGLIFGRELRTEELGRLGLPTPA